MPIQVTCPSCLKRFQVSEKFAGKSGPCPNCKKTIKVPEKNEEVVVHAPDDGAPKDRTGRSVLKPLERTETEVTRRGLVVTAVAVLVAIGLAIGLRMTGGPAGPPLWARIIGAWLIAPPLVWAGYTFVRDSELAPYIGSELRNRVLILSVIFAALWLFYAFLPSYLLDLRAAAEMSFVWFGIVFCLMLGVGAFASVATFELEFVSGLAHAGLYLIATLLLGLLSGITFAGKPIEDLRGRPRSADTAGVQALENVRVVKSLHPPDCWRCSALVGKETQTCDDSHGRTCAPDLENRATIQPHAAEKKAVSLFTLPAFSLQPDCVIDVA